MTGKLTWDINESITLTSITDYKAYDKLVSLDTDAGPTSHFLFFSDAETDTFSQELRLNGTSDKLNWVAGLYYLDIDNTTVTGLSFLSDSILTFGTPPFGLDSNPFDGVPGPGVDFVTDTSLETNSLSVFGQFDYEISESLTLVAGLRSIFEEKDYSFSQNAYVNTDDRKLDQGIFGFSIAQPDGTNPFDESPSDTLWAGKLQIEWRPNDDWLVYAGVNRGVKAGSFNGPLADGSTIPASAIAYDEEILLAYEAGFKSTLPGGSTRINGSIYYYDYSDYQAFTYINASGFITNEDATMKGIELEIISSPLEGLDVILGMSYVDANIDNVEIAPGVFRDVEPTFTPDLQLNGLIRYGWSALGGTAAIQFDAYYAASRFGNLRNFDAHEIDSNIVGNVRLFWDSSDETWQVSLFSTNIGDERVQTESFDVSTLCGCNAQHYANPRWYGGSVRYNF